MVWPILTSVSLAPGPYFFSASAEDEASATTDKIADKSRLGNLICIIFLSHSCRSRWTDVAFRHGRHRVILYVSIRLAPKQARPPVSQNPAGKAGCHLSSGARFAAPPWRLRSFHLRLGSCQAGPHSPDLPHMTTGSRLGHRLGTDC